MTRMTQPRCPTCSYSLLGLDTTVCPECGGTFRIVRAARLQCGSRRWLLIGLTGMLVCLALLAWSLGWSAPTSLVRWPTLLAILAASIFGGVCTRGIAGLRATCAAAIGRSLTAQERRQTHVCLLGMSGCAIAAGAIGSLLGVISMFRSLDDLSAVGPALGVSLFALLYGLVFALVFGSAAAALGEDINGQSEALPIGRLAAIVLVVVALGAGFTLSWAGAVLIAGSQPLPPPDWDESSIHQIGEGSPATTD